MKEVNSFTKCAQEFFLFGLLSAPSVVGGQYLSVFHNLLLIFLTLATTPLFTALRYLVVSVMESFGHSAVQMVDSCLSPLASSGCGFQRCDESVTTFCINMQILKLYFGPSSCCLSFLTSFFKNYVGFKGFQGIFWF